MLALTKQFVAMVQHHLQFQLLVLKQVTGQQQVTVQLRQTLPISQPLLITLQLVRQETSISCTMQPMHVVQITM